MNRSLKAIIIAGGQSSRMGRDKALLELDGSPLFARHVENLRLAGFNEIYISTRKDASYLPELKRLQVTPLFDLNESVGPASGLLAALDTSGDEEPDQAGASWLVTACDFPLANVSAFRYLIEEHLNARFEPEITCLSHDDGTPEPLFAIWTLGALAKLKANVDLGLRGPLATLKKCRFHELSAMTPEWLTNTNTPDEWAKLSDQSTTNLSSPKTR